VSVCVVGMGGGEDEMVVISMVQGCKCWAFVCSGEGDISNRRLIDDEGVGDC
jgi:hypothetical protein